MNRSDERAEEVPVSFKFGDLQRGFIKELVGSRGIRIR